MSRRYHLCFSLYKHFARKVHKSLQSGLLYILYDKKKLSKTGNNNENILTSKFSNKEK